MSSLALTHMNDIFNVKSGPRDLQTELVDDLPKKKALSRVRKLSKRLSSTFRSSLSLRDESDEENATATIDRKRKGKKSHLGRVLSLQAFHENELFTENSIPSQHAVSSMDLSSTNSHDNLRRVLSVPGSSTRTSPYGKLEYYTKLEQLGEGSYATVYKGISKVNNVFVALKEIRLQEEEGIPFTAIREASLLKDLKHANIVRLHDIIPAKEHLVLVFEYLHTDLCIFLEERPLGLHHHNAKLLLFQLFRGLHYIHEKQILHRDIKPQNVLLSNRGELKLADFGLARAKSVPSRTFTNEIVTLWYRPPDVLLGSTHYTTSLDIWGVGCIFVEMISGTPLFPGVKSARDQLCKIFKVCGTPSTEEWPYEMDGYNRSEFSGYQKQSLCNQAPRLGAIPDAEDLADQMLQFEPRRRISAAEGMKHPYFNDLPKAVHTIPTTTPIFVVPGLKMVDDYKRPSSNKPKTSRSGYGHFV